MSDDGYLLDIEDSGEASPSAVDGSASSQILPQQIAAAQAAASQLQRISAKQRSLALRAMSAALESQRDEILEANTLDLEASQEMAIPPLVQQWLKLTPERLQGAIRILDDLAEVSDPIQQVIPGQYQLQNAQVYGQRVPWGVVALISEAFPALGAIAAGLCLRTANALVVRGGSETSHSNRAIFSSLQQALEGADLPSQTLTLLPAEQGISLQDVLGESGLNLVIPYGRRSLVRQVLKGAMAPVIAPGLGNCCLYWSKSASLERVRWILQDSHHGEPESVNALETVLVPASINLSGLERLWQGLQQTGFVLKGDETLQREYPELPLAQAAEVIQANQRKTICFRIVENLSEAIDWINRYSSGHADAIATESYEESRQFATGIRSAAIYINASPKFERNPGSGANIALGMACQTSSGTGNIQGRIGLDALTRMSQIILG